MCRYLTFMLSCVLLPCFHAVGTPIAVRVVQEEGTSRPVIQAAALPVLSPLSTSGGVLVHRPDGIYEATYSEVREEANRVVLHSNAVPGAVLTDTYTQLGPDLIARRVSVEARVDFRYYLDLGWKVEKPGAFYSFTQEEGRSAAYTPGCSGPEFGGGSLQTFPFLGAVSEGTLYGVIGDTPGHWENRSFMAFDLEGRMLALRTGDGSARREIIFPFELDSTSVYRMYFDGWQRIEAGETQTFDSWIFSAPVQNQYDIQLAAHLALANAKGFNNSALEAILRNTSYVLLRRNLLRTESDHIFISGVGYGWKQWVTDGFYMSRGLDMPAYDASAHAGVFYERIAYEDNAQYYLIWSAIVQRAGGALDMRTVNRAWHFIRNHEREGLFYPPRLNPESKAFRTYMDILEYEDGDPPTANQGFHCGALLAARELGLEVPDADIAQSTAAYAAMFNEEGGYFPTSLQQQHHIGQDTLYGAVLTHAVFGEKLLPDALVQKHLETTMRIQSPYGMRVISQANGDLIEGHSGSYVFGGSWFLTDAANYLAGLIHGMDPAWVDQQLLWRLKKELAHMPAFHESINTLTGKPHGHHLYSWNSGFWWLRREVRKHLGMTGPDPLDAALDEALGVEKENGLLRLKPGVARPGFGGVEGESLAGEDENGQS